MNDSLIEKYPQTFWRNRFFIFMVAYRWASLIPAIWLLIVSQQRIHTQVISPALVLTFAIINNLFISFFHRHLNQWLEKYPLLLSIDMLFTAFLLAVSEGARSPYYLYALSPLLAGAFFLQIRGAITAAGFYTPLYFFAVTIGQRYSPNPIDANTLFTQLAGIWLITILFGYPSGLLNKLRYIRDDLMTTGENLSRQNEELEIAHRQLKIIHDLTTLIQSAPDIQTAQQQVLAAITEELGFSRAVVSLVDPISEHLGNWRSYPHVKLPENGLAALTLDPDNGPLIEGMLKRETRWFTPPDELTASASINSWLGDSTWLALPMTMQDHAVGVLLVAANGKSDSLPPDQLLVLTSVANHAAVVLGTTLLCIDRARNLAIEQERNRIARDIHDTVSQSLFGMVFSLDACIDILPNQPKMVRGELKELRSLASSARDEVRTSIYDLWHSSLTLEHFKSDLTNYTNHCCGTREFEVIFDTGGNFEKLSNGIRRSLYRVTQEALSNTIQHAQVSSAQVTINIEDEQVDLSIQDDGQGFDPPTVLSRSHNRERFGLHGILERVAAIGGKCEIISQVGSGTQILIKVPLNSRRKNGS